MPGSSKFGSQSPGGSAQEKALARAASAQHGGKGLGRAASASTVAKGVRLPLQPSTVAKGVRLPLQGRKEKEAKA